MVFVLWIFFSDAFAANYIWDTSASGGYQAGDGTWGIDSYWTINGTTLNPWPGTGNTATFAGSNGNYAITVSGTQNVNGLTFSNSQYTISNGTLSLKGSPISVAGGVSALISSIISGSNGLTLSGGGTLTLSGSNFNLGITTINSGILSVNTLANGGVNCAVGASANGPANLVINGGILQYTGSGSTTNRRFTIGSSGSSIDASGTGTVIFSATGAITISGAGTRTFTLTGTNTGNNRLACTVGDDGSGNKTNIVKTGPGVWQRTSNSSYTGYTAIYDGTLSVNAVLNGGSNSRLGKSGNAAGNLIIDGGTLRYYGNTVSNSNRLFTLGTNGGTLEIIGGGSLSLSNTGFVVISGVGNRTLNLTGTNANDIIFRR